MLRNRIIPVNSHFVVFGSARSANRSLLTSVSYLMSTRLVWGLVSPFNSLVYHSLIRMYLSNCLLYCVAQFLLFVSFFLPLCLACLLSCRVQNFPKFFMLFPTIEMFIQPLCQRYLYIVCVSASKEKKSSGPVSRSALSPATLVCF